MRFGWDRRQFLTFSSAAATAALACPALARAHGRDRAIAFYNLHTGESLRTVYRVAGHYVADGLREINHALRDFRTGEVRPIDPKLIDLLHRLHGLLGSSEPYHLVSGYRSPKTNAMLRRRGAGVARRSYHMRGMAVDVALPDIRLAGLHRAALSLRAGGVGYYPDAGFVHVDTGRVRAW